MEREGERERKREYLNCLLFRNGGNHFDGRCVRTFGYKTKKRKIRNESNRICGTKKKKILSIQIL